MSALAKFGAPLGGITKKDFTNPELILQIGVEPNRIDILMGIAGVQFQDAWDKKIQDFYDDVPVFFLDKENLILAKKAASRPQDLLDIEKLLRKKKMSTSTPPKRSPKNPLPKKSK